jgi:hypothetical protein
LTIPVAPLIDTEYEMRTQSTADTDYSQDWTGFTVTEIGTIQADVVGGLEYMDTIDVTSDVTSVLFGAGGDGATGRSLDGEVDGGYLVSYVLTDPGATTLLSMRPNSLDPTVVTDFYAAANYDGSSPVNPVYTSWSISGQADGYTEIGSLEIQDPATGRNRGFTGTSALINPASGRFAGSYGGLWDDTTTPITSLQFLSDTASGIKAGSRFILWRKTRQNVRADSASTYERNVETTVSGTAATVTYTTGSANFDGSAVGISATLIEDTVTAGTVTVELKIDSSVVLTALLDTTNTAYARAAAPIGIYPVSAGDTIEVDVTTSSLTTTSAGRPGLVINTTLTNDAFVQAPIGSDYLIAALSADQTTNIALGNHIEFDSASSRGTSITMSTGAGQLDGLFTLQPGKAYEIHAHISGYTNEGSNRSQWTLHPSDAALVDDTGTDAALHVHVDNTGDLNNFHSSVHIFTPSVETVIKIDRVAPDANFVQWMAGTRVLIKEIG